MLRREFLSALPFALGFTAAGRGFADSGPVVKSILEFGAKPDGQTLNTMAIQRATDAVFQAGGGTVRVPAGIFLTGRIELRSAVTLISKRNLRCWVAHPLATTVPAPIPATATGPTRGTSSSSRMLKM